MGSPHNPQPAPSSRRGSQTLTIVLLILALVVVLSAVAVWIGLRFLSQNIQVRTHQSGGETKEVTVDTPLGSLDVRQDHGKIDEAKIGLPIYPGAQQVPGRKSPTVDIGLPQGKQVRVLTGVFETTDSLDKVAAFYRDRLTGEKEKFVEKQGKNGMVFTLDYDRGEKVVVLEKKPNVTQLILVRVGHGDEQTN